MLDELLRVAAAADVEVTHLVDPGSRVSWRQAPLVLIDVAAVPRAVALALPRRPGVVAIAHAEPTAVPWDDCIRLGVDRTIRLAQADDDLIELLADTASTDPGDGELVAVVGACGGAGASVFATALAAAAGRRSRRVLLADCDRWGAGLDVILGVENAGGVHWGTLAAPSGRLSAVALHQALPTVPVGSGRISVLCHPRTGEGNSPPEDLTPRSSTSSSVPAAGPVTWSWRTWPAAWDRPGNGSSNGPIWLSWSPRPTSAVASEAPGSRPG